MIRSHREPVRPAIEAHHARAAQPRKQHHREANGPGAGDEHALTPPGGPRAPHGVRADGEELQHRGLVEADAFDLCAQSRRAPSGTQQSRRRVHAQHLDVGAAVGACPLRQTMQRPQDR